MKTKWKIVIGIAVLLIIAAGVFASVKYSQKGIITVQTGHAAKQDLASVVTASGEIKPRNYINIGANAQGELTSITVKEGDHVRKGQTLARIENIQPAADVVAQRATISSAEADAAASEAGQKAAEDNLITMQATIDRSRADLEKALLDFQRSKELFDQKLIAKQDYDQKKTTYDSQLAALREAEARMVQAKAQIAQAAAQTAASQRRIAQSKAGLARFNDILDKRNVYAPLDGVVTNLPVRVGEVVVPGIQNSASSTIMTIADMSIITAEVKVDESDIINVKLDQQADVNVDALNSKVLKGHVIEIGNTAILRSTGVAASQSTVSSQEAKDFKVVIALDNPPDNIRPGLSCTAKITTAQRPHTLTIPIQALTTRQKGDLEPKAKGAAPPSGVKLSPAEQRAKKEEVQGVFIVASGKAKFTKVETGITGATDIEVLSGLTDGAEIIT
ncbi:MAG: efflux RND transporter periplasmic adaptor subunit, partial [Acidobacteriota bacterium]|nr:efflux RND transporter periplasmic adaptor subunit [Acidobacteriota bacterium]